MKKLILAVFIVACSGRISGVDHTPLGPSSYLSGKVEINLHENGDLVFCRMDSLAKLSGKWSQKGDVLTLVFQLSTTYSDMSKTDSATIRIDSTVAWKINKSEFGFHRLIGNGDGVYDEEVYLKEGAPNMGCTFK